MNMTKQEVKAALGYSTDVELAKLFAIGRWAVGQWKDDEPIPDQRQWELRARFPDLFPLPQGSSGNSNDAKAAA